MANERNENLVRGSFVTYVDGIQAGSLNIRLGDTGREHTVLGASLHGNEGAHGGEYYVYVW